MSTVDEILASGRYTDRRGRKWGVVTFGRGWGLVDDCGYSIAGITFTPSRMRLLIERDQHRDECRGLRRCIDHPVPAVISWTGKISYPQFGAHWRGRAHYASTLPEAMDAARALAVGE